jgi:hypothetical protein
MIVAMDRLAVASFFENRTLMNGSSSQTRRVISAESEFWNQRIGAEEGQAKCLHEKKAPACRLPFISSMWITTKTTKVLRRYKCCVVLGG